MLVGEQPGDQEDIEGEPFVGPAGGLLESVIKSAGIARRDAYLTNAVKHFKVRETRQASHPQAPLQHRDPGLPHVARAGATTGPPSRRRLLGNDGRPCRARAGRDHPLGP